MAVFKRGGMWWYQFYYRSQRIQESTRQGNRRVALDMQAARRTALAKGEVGILAQKPIPRFDAAMAQFLSFAKQEHQAHPSTYRRLVVSSKPLLRRFRQFVINAITSDAVEGYKQHRIAVKSCLTKRKLRPATVNREIACLRAMLNFFVRQDVLAKNPVARVRLLNEENEATRVVTPDEEAKYLLACSQPLGDVATLILQTGMRPEEVQRIRLENVNLKQGFVSNPHGKTKAAKRKIPLTSVAEGVLARRIANAKGPYLFGREDDPSRPITKLNATHCRAVKRSGVTWFRLYDLRHTFATRMVESGADLITLAALLGHSRIQMVQRYAHPSEGHKIDAIKRMELSAEKQE